MNARDSLKGQTPYQHLLEPNNNWCSTAESHHTCFAIIRFFRICLLASEKITDMVAEATEHVTYVRVVAAIAAVIK